MGLFNALKGKLTEHTGSPGHSSSHPSSSAPPEWAPAPEVSVRPFSLHTPSKHSLTTPLPPQHQFGKYNEAPEQEYQDAERFCQQYPPNAPRLLPSAAVDAINNVGCRAWGIEIPITPRFQGTIQNLHDSKKSDDGVVHIQTYAGCKDVCLLSDLPILAGLYDIHGKTGVYFEVAIHKMDGIIAVGTACRPYPVWRLPGWNRLSAGLHLDDFCKFFEDPDGGRDYDDHLQRNFRIHNGYPATIGCGYEFTTGALFYTLNGERLKNAFTGIYMPRHQYDVFAAIGVEGDCVFDVNFGAEPFKWKAGNEWAWRAEGHVGRMLGGPSGPDDELPSYSEARFS
ncbi:hypothetical protein BDQ12DRAFT_152393 [Crucibulum laeve]|uniref:SPRY domain-containing protein n=1 Tax=Crucibulum laeve TaxID=68775 RepID=A0A5C3M961_9AGAR|nr:hypothetical protein BDQ12DRAFT_152393 [Crucibulum laeve]